MSTLRGSTTSDLADRLVTLSASFILGLRDDPERLAALAYLANEAERYPPGLFTPPLTRPKNDDRDKAYAALAFHVEPWGEAASDRIVSVEVCQDGRVERDFPPEDRDLSDWLARHVLNHKYASTLYVCNGGRIGILDIFLQTVGPHLLGDGYSIEPCMGQHGISWLKIRRGKRSWTITTAETLSGVPLSTLLDFAQTASDLPADQLGPAEILYGAISAYTGFLRASFGTALRPTVGMIASAAARRFLPESVLKWRPSPLLIAMERVGMGYRGGVAYGSKFRGDVHRIDVNRQYSALLREELPCDAVFDRFGGASDGRIGVFVCTIETDTPLVYPVGSWQPSERRFTYGGVASGRTVCVLHTSEFPGLYAKGVRIEAGFGFAYRSTFSLGPYVEAIEDVTRRYGRTSAVGAVTKPLGNMVYGKFGQKPDRWQLCYSLEKPGDDWHPYFNEQLEDVAGVWERDHTRYTQGMHVDIAAHITGAARSQLLTTWARLEAYGYHVVRAHTDSITTSRDPREVMVTDAEVFGAWKYEGGFADALFVGPNSFALGDTGHIAGIPNVSRSDLEELHAEGRITLSRVQKGPRHGWERADRIVTRTLTG